MKFTAEVFFLWHHSGTQEKNSPSTIARQPSSVTRVRTSSEQGSGFLFHLLLAFLRHRGVQAREGAAGTAWERRPSLMVKPNPCILPHKQVTGQMPLKVKPCPLDSSCKRGRPPGRSGGMERLSGRLRARLGARLGWGPPSWAPGPPSQPLTLRAAT